MTCGTHWSLNEGLLRELNPGPLAPGARIIPLDQAADGILKKANTHEPHALSGGQRCGRWGEVGGVAPGCSGVLGTPGCPWVFLCSLGCAWVLPGCAWVPLGVTGCPWVSLGVLGCSWVSLEDPGCSWAALGAPGGSLGCPWVSLGGLGCPWVYLGVPGCPWVFLGAPWCA